MTGRKPAESTQRYMKRTKPSKKQKISHDLSYSLHNSDSTVNPTPNFVSFTNQEMQQSGESINLSEMLLTSGRQTQLSKSATSITAISIFPHNILFTVGQHVMLIFSDPLIQFTVNAMT